MRKILLILLCFLFVTSSAQVYHYKTGECIAHSKVGLYNKNMGVFANYSAEYYILLTPENHKVTNSRLINIPVIRIKSSNTNTTKTPIFILHGGPGQSNLQKQLLFGDLLSKHDVIIIGYRGVDGQVCLKCSNQHSENECNNVVNADSCIANFQNNNIDIKGYTVTNMLEDIELVRKYFKYSKISLLAFSFGTVVAQEYAYNYQQYVDKQLYIAPRAVSDINIDAEILNTQLCKLFRYYNKTSDTDEEILNKIETLLYNFKQQTNINFNLFVLFIFNQLYTTNSIPTFIDAIKMSNNGEFSKINSLYNKYIKKYNASNIAWGDIFLKKQDRKHFNTHNSINTAGDLFVQAVNTIYNPQYKAKADDYKNVIIKPKTDNLFVILGEFDVASPPQQWIQAVQPHTESYIILPHTGHFDYFFEQRTKVNNILLNFF